ncbi:MAG: hypothetical protein K2I71_04880, partial [Helicobacter sp.]|nr:hypothetical protein [Helicobacter sp.]
PPPAPPPPPHPHPHPKLSYLIDSDGQTLKLYLGIGNLAGSVTTESITNSTFLRDNFKGVYAGSHCKVCEQNPLQAPLAYSQAMLGIPSLKKSHLQNKENKGYCVSIVGRKNR